MRSCKIVNLHLRNIELINFIIIKILCIKWNFKKYIYKGILFSVTIPSRYQNTQHFPVSSWFFPLYSSSCGGKVRRVTGHYCLAITLKDVPAIFIVLFIYVVHC